MSAPPSRALRGVCTGQTLGDYTVLRQIGSGAYSKVFLCRHARRGIEVAVKEIEVREISDKLRQSLLFEVDILKRIRHPNIIALYDSFQIDGMLYLVLEYCRGGDLSMYIHRRGKLPEQEAKLFLRQLTTGLQELRKHNVVHRDLKPQNILLATNEDDILLKIADFGFAKDLEPQSLADTVCGSPLYMAPEIMHGYKYDSKADIWSMGIILFQLLTGHTPYNGNNQIQLFKNIINSNELRFPPNCKLSHDCIDLCKKLLQISPVERPTIEEVVNHKFLSEQVPDQTLSHKPSSTKDELSYFRKPARQSSHEDCMPFQLDDETNSQDESPPVPESSEAVKSPYGLSVCRKGDKTKEYAPSKGPLTRYGFSSKVADFYRLRDYSGQIQQRQKSVVTEVSRSYPEESPITDSLEFIDQEYVFVSGPNAESSSSSVSALRPPNSPSKSSPVACSVLNAPSAPMPISNAAINRQCSIGSLESHSSPISGTSQGSVDMFDEMDQPSLNIINRITSLQLCASAISEIVKDETENGKRLEAFSLQLVVLAIWKHAMQMCTTNAPTFGGSQLLDVKRNESGGASGLHEICPQFDSLFSRIEREFLRELSHAEEISASIGQISEATGMPDAIEMIFQSALQFGRDGGANETIGNTDTAVTQYYKAVCFLRFLLTEAPLLPTTPALTLSKADRHRLRTYVDVLSSRLSHLQFQKR